MGLILFMVVVGFIIFLGFIIIVNVIHFSRWAKGRDLAAYREEHPNHVRNGRVSCFVCEGNSIFLRQSGGHGLNSHVCRTCGTELYRSKT